MNLLYAQVGVSNRHIHLSPVHVAALFGAGYVCTPQRELFQPGQYAMAERVTLRGPKGELQNVRVLGPERRETQVELSKTDCFKLGIPACVRQSGDIGGTPGLEVIGPIGRVTLAEGAIVAARHLHVSACEALAQGLRDGQWASAYAAGARATRFERVLVRVSPRFRCELHLDTDEANAAGLENGQRVAIIWE